MQASSNIICLGKIQNNIVNIRNFID